MIRKINIVVGYFFIFTILFSAVPTKNEFIYSVNYNFSYAAYERLVAHTYEDGQRLFFALATKFVDDVVYQKLNRFYRFLKVF